MKKTLFILSLFTSITSIAQFNSVRKIVPTKSIEKTVDEKPKTVTTNTTTTQAENPSSGYNGKAKVFVDKFWLIVEDLKKLGTNDISGKAHQYKTLLDKANVQLKYVKQKDPSYDVTAMEQVLKPYEEGLTTYFQEKKDAVQSQLKNNDKNGDGVAGLFMASSTTEIRTSGNTETDIAQHKEQIKAYNEKVEKLVESSPLSSDYFDTYIRNQVKPAKERLAQLEVSANKAVGINGMIDYRELVGIEAYWNAANRVFKNVPETVQVQQMVATALKKMGTEEQMRAKIEANYVKLIKSRKMQAAVVVNAALEKEFKRVFNNNFKELTILKINIITSEWTTIRNSLTGIILGRTQAASIAAKTKDGKCVLYNYTIGQPYNGNGYGLAAENTRYTEGEIHCDNVK